MEGNDGLKWWWKCDFARDFRNVARWRYPENYENHEIPENIAGVKSPENHENHENAEI